MTRKGWKWEICVLVALVFAAFGAGWTWDEGTALAGGGRMVDDGGGGGCTIGTTWYAGGHHYACTNWNGVGMVIEIP